jgi:LPXTG-motif cell wall-anchored protein
MKNIRRLTAVLSITLLTTGSTVAYADDDAPPDTSTTTTTEPSPKVTIVVEDVPAPVEEPKTSAVPTTAESASAEDSPPEPSTGAVHDDGSSNLEQMPTIVDDGGTTPGSMVEVAPTTTLNPVQVHSDESAVVTGTQQADANTGGNATSNSQPGTTGGQQPNAIDTGAADAIGSQDTNVVDQQAQVVLTEQAVANLLQVALILNIGAALANSGINDAVSTPGGSGIAGAIDSGNATAIGNDMAQYITQAARATGDENTDDAAKQLAISLWMGLANANTGINSATGTGVAGSGGDIGSGDAAAVGNQSISDILQQASLTGSGTSQVNVEQYATIMNIGFALANSGVNEITGAAGGILTAGDNQTQNDLAMDLFAMLLPALLQNFAGSSGQGVIGTGDATAIGNRSETYVHQLAEAAASGDGIASIVQDVLVANVGAAGANTGGNTLGGRYASLDPDMAKAVVTLAAFLSQMLALVHTQSAETALAMQNAGMEIPFGDIVLQVQGQMQGVDTTLDGVDGARANIRQITIILSLGIAQSNSGLNTAIGVDQQNALATSVNATDFMGTGDAFAANDGLVIICQRRNADDVACLAPPVPEVPVDEPVGSVDEPTTSTTQVAPESAVAPPDTTLVAAASSTNGERPAGPQALTSPSPTSTHSSSALPSTGSNVADIMLYAGAALLLGFGLLLLATRRRGVPGDDWKLYEKS